MVDYSKITNEEFSDILADIVMERSSTLLDVPGVYEAVSEEFNNEVLDRWAEENPTKARKPIDISTIDGAICSFCRKRAKFDKELEIRLCCAVIVLVKKT